MKALHAWTARQRKRELRRPRLDDALLTNRGFAYGSYRLRYLVWRIILRAALHMIEVAIFSSIFTLDIIGPVLVVRALTAVGAGLWWGGLEQLRTRVRQQAKDKSWLSVRKTVDAWLTLGATLGLLILGVSTGWIVQHPNPEFGFSVFDAYAIACILRLALDMIGRTYHSGIFALRRIYRPLWSLLISDILDVAGVVVLWPYLGAWSFGPVFAVSGMVRTGLVIGFVRQAYIHSKIPPLRFRFLLRTVRTFRLDDLIGFAKHGLANAAFLIDSLLILTLVYASARSPEYMALAVLFYVLRPFFAAGSSWVRLFYFDFKKLDLQTSAFFRARFARFGKQVALLFSLVTIALAVLWTIAFWRGPGIDWTVAILLPFFIARSFLGLYQMQAFSYGHYKYLLATGGILGLAILSLGIVPQSRLVVLSIISTITVLVVLIAGPPKTDSDQKARSRHDDLVSFPRWLRLLASAKGMLRVGIARVGAHSASVPRVAKELSTVLESGAISRLGKRFILWFELGDSAAPATPGRIAAATVGCLATCKLSGFTQRGIQALKEVASQTELGTNLEGLFPDTARKTHTPAELRQEFERRFPQGSILDKQGGTLPGELAVDTNEIHHILLQAASGMEAASPGRQHKGIADVSLYCPGGEPEMIFVVDRKTDLDKRLAWRHLVRSATLAHSIAPGKITP